MVRSSVAITPRFLLIDEGLEAVGEVARQGLQQTGGLDQRGLQRSGELGQQHVAARQIGERFDVLGRTSTCRPSTPPLMTSNGLVRPRRVSALATPAASPLTNVMALGPDQQFGETVDARLLGAEASQRVLVHLVLATGCDAADGEGCQLADAHAAVLGDDHRVGSSQLGRDFVDDGDFLRHGGSHVFMYTSSRFDSGCSLCSEHREEREALVP